ncbi:PilN domain-containing protein [Candidatus Zixiibacteriota bacterium]
MSKPAKVIRGANFAYPWSERADFYSPRMVQLMIGISALMVLALVALPFILNNLERGVLLQRGEVNANANALRMQVDAAAPMIETKALLDSIRADLNTRVGLRQQIMMADYPADRLLLHLSELVPDGIILTNLTVQPAATRTVGRPATATGGEEIPEEIENTDSITIIGSAQNADTFNTFFRAVEQSPLFWGPTQVVRPLETTLSFTISCRLPGSGVEITGEGG